MSRYILHTLGCKANFADSQQIEHALQKQGWTALRKGAVEDEVQLCIVNSCTVTDEADRQSRKMATRLARQYPKAKVVMTGCSAEVDPQKMAEVPGVHFVVGNQNKDQLADFVIGSHILKAPPQILGTVQNYDQLLSQHPIDREWPSLSSAFQAPQTSPSFSLRTRTFLKIQEGCEAFCTYCIIPYGRGPNRSLSPQEVVQQIRELCGQGVQEVVLTGTNLGDYKDGTFGDLLESILEKTQLGRLRLSSLSPVEITPQILTLMQQSPRLCPHFHVSLQSPRSRILRLMKRRYGFPEVKECLEKIAGLPAPLGGVFVGMDLIAGFPGETEEEFEEGYQALRSLPWTRLHVFPYSEREGTPATRLPGSVPRSIRIQRVRKLNQLSLERLTQHYRRILELSRQRAQPIESILMEKLGEKGWFAGYTPNYIRVLIPSSRNLRSNDVESVERNQIRSLWPSDLITDSGAGEVALVGQLTPDQARAHSGAPG